MRDAAQSQDDILGVVWDKPDGRGGWISEASCWVEGCHVRIEGYDLEEVERLIANHHETFHGGTDAKP